MKQKENINTEDEDEVAKELKREKNRRKQREKRIEMKKLQLEKKTLRYQKMINENRQQFGLKKRKIQGNIGIYFKGKEKKRQKNSEIKKNTQANNIKTSLDAKNTTSKKKIEKTRKDSES